MSVTAAVINASKPIPWLVFCLSTDDLCWECSFAAALYECCACDARACVTRKIFFSVITFRRLCCYSNNLLQLVYPFWHSKLVSFVWLSLSLCCNTKGPFTCSSPFARRRRTLRDLRRVRRRRCSTHDDRTNRLFYKNDKKPWPGAMATVSCYSVGLYHKKERRIWPFPLSRNSDSPRVWAYTMIYTQIIVCGQTWMFYAIKINFVRTRLLIFNFNNAWPLWMPAKSC